MVEVKRERKRELSVRDCGWVLVTRRQKTTKIVFIFPCHCAVTPLISSTFFYPTQLNDNDDDDNCYYLVVDRENLRL